MGASGSSASKPLATLFGAEEDEAKRGPTLAGLLVPGPEASWRLTLSSPLRIEAFDGYTAKGIPSEDWDQVALKAIQDHVPFTACSTSEPQDASDASDEGPHTFLAMGCQDGTSLVFGLSMGTVTGPLHELRNVAAPQEELASRGTGEGGAGGEGRAALSVTVLKFWGRQALFAGSGGRCMYWNLRTGELEREFVLPGEREQPAVPSTLAVVPGRAGEEGAEAKTCLWVGMDTGSIAVFDVNTGAMVRSFSCAGPEALVSLAHFPAEGVVFVLSAHRRVSVWDAATYACTQKYPAELMTCGADLSAMISASMSDPDLNLLMLAGVDGSLCVRRVSRRNDGKLNCVLLSFFELVSADGAPITSLSYHEPTDTVVIGDAGCRVALLCKLKDQLGTSVQAQNEQQRPAGSVNSSEYSPSASPARNSRRGLSPSPSPAPGAPAASPPAAPTRLGLAEPEEAAAEAGASPAAAAASGSPSSPAAGAAGAGEEEPPVSPPAARGLEATLAAASPVSLDQLCQEGEGTETL